MILRTDRKPIPGRGALLILTCKSFRVLCFLFKNDEQASDIQNICDKASCPSKLYFIVPLFLLLLLLLLLLLFTLFLFIELLFTELRYLLSRNIIVEGAPDMLPSYSFSPKFEVLEDGWNFYQEIDELHRMGIPNNYWRLSKVNHDRKVKQKYIYMY